MSYVDCPRCGHRALSIATRCPQCGHAFESRLWQNPVSSGRPRRMPAGLIIIGVVVVLVALATERRSRRPAPAAPTFPAPAAFQPAPPAPVDTALEAGPPADSMPAGDSLPRPGPVLPDTAVPVASPPDEPGLERRIANTWVNVRSARNGSAAVLHVLSPGDTVQVDSLGQGWYRIVVGGQGHGYVDRSYLDPPP